MVDVCQDIESKNETFGEKACAVSSFIEGAEKWFRSLKYKMPSAVECAAGDGSRLAFDKLPGGKWCLIVFRQHPTNPDQMAQIILAAAPLVLKVAVAPKIPLLIKQYREQQLKLIAEIDNLGDVIAAARDYGIYDDSQPNEFTEETKHEGPKRP